MSKFCKNCGESLNDDAAFCGKCGTRVEEQKEQPAAQPAEQEAAPSSCEACNAGQCDQQPATREDGFTAKVNAFVGKLKNKDKKAIGITGGILAALILIVVLVICLSGGGPEKALDNYLDVIFYGKVSKIEKLAPKEYWDYVEEASDMDLEDIEDTAKDLYKDKIRSLEDEYGDDIKISYKITETDDVKKSMLDTMKDNIKEKYDIPKKNVTDAVEMEVELTIKGDDDEETLDGNIYYAIKVDGDWYICSSDGSFLIG